MNFKEMWENHVWYTFSYEFVSKLQKYWIIMFVAQN